MGAMLRWEDSLFELSLSSEFEFSFLSPLFIARFQRVQKTALQVEIYINNSFPFINRRTIKHFKKSISLILMLTFLPIFYFSI